MTNSIDNVSGFGNYGVGGYIPNRKDNQVAENPTAEPSVSNYEETQVEPEKIMDFLASNNYFIAPATTKTVAPTVDQATQDRVAGYMENFEMIYGVIVEEFGEEFAPDVMNFCMDYLMGIAA